jgi:predicted RNA-binding Zn-ribbon protein involved in translation (DUF1610 family)
MSAVVAPVTAEHASATPAATPRAEPRGDYTCPRCGHFMRVFGGGRHRIYFERDNAKLDDPIMDGVCPKCGLGLPGKQ